MSDGHRERELAEVKSSSPRHDANARRVAVRSIAWLDVRVKNMLVRSD